MLENWWRLLAALGVTATTLAVGTSATSAAVSPRLVVVSNGTALTVHYSQDAEGSALARLDVLVPEEYLLRGGLPDGEEIGRLDARIGGAHVTAPLTAASPTTRTTLDGGVTTLAMQYPACTGDPLAAATQFWLARLDSVVIPVFVVQILPNTPMSFTAFYAIKACLPASATVSELTLTFDRLWSVPPGWYLWRALAYPYANGVRSDVARTEGQSIDRVPQALTLSSKGRGWLAGRLQQGGRGVGGVKVAIKRGARVVAGATTNGSGRFRVRLREGGTVTASASVPERSGGTCIANVDLASTCSGVTLGGLTLSSAPVVVRR